jgi:hypothetical protein
MKEDCRCVLESPFEEEVVVWEEIVVRKVRWKTEEDFIGRYLARRNTSDQVE